MDKSTGTCQGLSMLIYISCQEWAAVKRPRIPSNIPDQEKKSLYEKRHLALGSAHCLLLKVSGELNQTEKRIVILCCQSGRFVRQEIFHRLHPSDNGGIGLKRIWYLFTRSSTAWKEAIVDRQQLLSCSVSCWYFCECFWPNKWLWDSTPLIQLLFSYCFKAEI